VIAIYRNILFESITRRSFVKILFTLLLLLLILFNYM